MFRQKNDENDAKILNFRLRVRHVQSNHDQK